MPRSTRDTRPSCHTRDESAWSAHGINIVTSIGILDQMHLSVFVKNALFLRCAASTISFKNATQCLIMRTLILWHSLDMGLATGEHLSLSADNNHHYHLLTRNKLNCVSLFMQMGQPFQTWVLWLVTVSPCVPLCLLTSLVTSHISAINNIQDVWCLAPAASHAKPETCFELNICNNLMK